MATPVGLDLSLTSTGWSAGDDQRVVTPNCTGVDRLVEIRDTLAGWLAQIPTPLVAVEGYSFASRASQAHAIGELGGVVRVMLHERQIPWVEIPPTCRAKFATGRGNASKNEVISSISARTGIVWSGKGADDRCDAWILEQMLRSHLGTTDYKWPETHLAALVTLDWTQIDTYTCPHNY